MKIAILGWGSLLWDKQADFERQHREWQFDGPVLKVEFCRVSETRSDALTLVIDTLHGSPCQVAYTFSRRVIPDDAICDLRCREGTTLKNIGVYFRESSQEPAGDPESVQAIKTWASEKNIDAVVWTALASNFKAKSRVKKAFSVPNAISHIQALDAEGKAKAAEYVWRAKDFIKTPLRTAIQVHPWFAKRRGRK